MLLRSSLAAIRAKGGCALGEIRFKAGWDAAGNNALVYPAHADHRGNEVAAAGRSKREIYVIINKLPKARLWCHPREEGKIRNFVNCVSDPNTPLSVDKGIHDDKYARAFGQHLSVGVDWGPFSDLKCHLYGNVMRNGAWEVELITLFDPRIWYRGPDLILLQRGEVPSDPIVVVHGGLPPVRFGSIAYYERDVTL
jgi:hypothetical protein